MLVAASWIVRFSLGWDELPQHDRQELQRHFSMTPAPGAGSPETWEVRVRSDTAATAVHDVGRMLGPGREHRLVHISAALDLAERVGVAAPW